MRIGGLQKVSFIDYPGKIAAVVFTQGCNWRCPFCHNPSLVLPGKFEQPVNTDTVFEFLSRRSRNLDGLVISGGEPTLQPGLELFIDRCRSLGYAIKLDSNGSRPNVLQSLLSSARLDYVAIDVKAPSEDYPTATGCPVDTDAIRQSIRLLHESGVAYELRTTIVPGLHTLAAITKLAALIDGCKRFRMQVFRPGNTVDPQSANLTPPTPNTLSQMASILRHHTDHFIPADNYLSTGSPVVLKLKG